MRSRYWILAGVLAALGGAAARCTPHREVLLEPARVEVWTAVGAVADLSPAGDRVWMASAGGLLSVERGQVRERLRQPEIAWRGVAARGEDTAAVGLRHVTWLHRGGWRTVELPPRVEGYSVSADKHGWWVGHSAGLQRLRPESGLEPETRGDGPVRTLASDGELSWALTRDRLYGPHGAELPLPEKVAGPWSAAAFRGSLLLAGTNSDEPLRVWKWSGTWTALPVIPGRGSHVTALGYGPKVIAAVAGDGWWELRGRRWTRFAGSLPDALARDTAALARTSSGWLGTARSGGVWRLVGSAWQPVPLPSELPTANIQALAQYQGAVYASTFDRGVLMQSGSRWMEIGTAEGPMYPRQMAVAAGRLFVREADGRVSAFDGRTWERDLLRHQVKRSWIGALIPFNGGLAMGGWGTVITGLPGAWKELHLPAPWNQVGLTTLAGSGTTLWAGTGKNGVLRIDLESGRCVQAPGGPADPWVTSLAADGERVLAGTAAGHLGTLRGEYRDLVAAVTALAMLPDGSDVAATRDTVYWRTKGGWERLPCPLVEALEPQALLFTGDALWVGGRHGLVRVPVAP